MLGRFDEVRAETVAAIKEAASAMAEARDECPSHGEFHEYLEMHGLIEWPNKDDRAALINIGHVMRDDPDVVDEVLSETARFNLANIWKIDISPRLDGRFRHGDENDALGGRPQDGARVRRASADESDDAVRRVVGRLTKAARARDRRKAERMARDMSKMTPDMRDGVARRLTSLGDDSVKYGEFLRQLAGMVIS
jgi:hypothetical protein